MKDFLKHTAEHLAGDIAHDAWKGAWKWIGGVLLGSGLVSTVLIEVADAMGPFLTAPIPLWAGLVGALTLLLGGLIAWRRSTARRAQEAKTELQAALANIRGNAAGKQREVNRDTTMEEDAVLKVVAEFDGAYINESDVAAVLDTPAYVAESTLLTLREKGLLKDIIGNGRFFALNHEGMKLAKEKGFFDKPFRKRTRASSRI